MFGKCIICIDICLLCCVCYNINGHCRTPRETGHKINQLDRYMTTLYNVHIWFKNNFLHKIFVTLILFNISSLISLNWKMLYRIATLYLISFSMKRLDFNLCWWTLIFVHYQTHWCIKSEQYIHKAIIINCFFFSCHFTRLIYY